MASQKRSTENETKPKKNTGKKSASSSGGKASSSSKKKESVKAKEPVREKPVVYRPNMLARGIGAAGTAAVFREGGGLILATGRMVPPPNPGDRAAGARCGFPGGRRMQRAADAGGKQGSRMNEQSMKNHVF